MNTADTYKKQDDEGNELVVEKGKVKLRLASENFARNLGTIVGSTLHVERDSFRHLHHKSNSYGFNYNLLKLPLFRNVVVKVNGSDFYKVPKETIIEKGKIMFFKKTKAGSFEVQIFFNRNDLERFKCDQSQLDDDEASEAFIAELIKHSDKAIQEERKDSK